ncbi:MAG: glycosyltransferase family 2 protein [Cyclobacteriaceae bacterium]
MKVLISILNWNRTLLTRRCVKSVLKASFEHDYEILVVDNDSRDRSIESIEELGENVKLVRNGSNLGFADGHYIAVNYGLQKGFELLWLLNNDAVVEPLTLSKLVDSYQAKPNAIYGSLIRYSSELNFHGGYITEGKEIDKRVEIELKIVNSVNGASMVIPFKIISVHGWMKSDFFLYEEEVEYCKRLRSKGVKSYLVFNSVVDHEGGGSYWNEKLGYVRDYYKLRNHLFAGIDNGTITRREVVKIWGGHSRFPVFWLKCILYWLGIDSLFSLKFYLKSLSYYHVILNRRGKTLAPEDFLNTENDC